VRNRHEYKGFQIDVFATQTRSGGYVASVTLTQQDADITERKFDLPLDEDLFSPEEVLREGMQYGCDLIDGLLPWFNPQSMR
jgi:hypothetical protein